MELQTMASTVLPERRWYLSEVNRLNKEFDIEKYRNAKLVVKNILSPYFTEDWQERVPNPLSTFQLDIEFVHRAVFVIRAFVCEDGKEDQKINIPDYENLDLEDENLSWSNYIEYLRQRVMIFKEYETRFKQNKAKDEKKLHNRPKRTSGHKRLH